VHARLWTAGHPLRVPSAGPAPTRAADLDRRFAPTRAADLDRRFALTDRAAIDLQFSCGPWTTSPTRGSPRTEEATMILDTNAANLLGLSAP
jgi:hypothetical protein